jgi:dTDP-D-glucose 4,6-dehydratase
VFKIGGHVLCLRAKSIHFVGHLPREDFRAYFQSTDKVYRYDDIDGLATEASPFVRRGDSRVSPYAKDKAEVEQSLTSSANYFMEHGFPFLIGNLVNVIGPGDLKNKERLMQGAVHTWMRGLGPYKIVKANLGYKRQYIPVSDACNAIVTILENGEPQNKYNISNGVTLSNEQAIRLVQEAFKELIEEGKIPPVKTDYVAIDDRNFRAGADKEDPEEGLLADKLLSLGYRPQYPGTEGIKLVIREMILAEWAALQQEKAMQAPALGDLMPGTLQMAREMGDAITRNAVQGADSGYSINYYEKHQPLVRLKIVVDGNSAQSQLNKAREEILSRFRAGGVYPVSASHEVSKEDGAFRGKTEIKFFVEVPLSEIEQAEKLLNAWMGKKPAIGADVMEGLKVVSDGAQDAGGTEHPGLKPGVRGGKARRSL